MGCNSFILPPKFSSFAVFFLVTLLMFFPTTSSAATGGISGGKSNETDLQALLQFKSKITKNPFGVLSSWNSSIHFCHWRGVKCGRQHQRVTVLDLQSSKFSGTISPHIGNLSFLRVLILQNNSFSDEIPQEIFRLHRLETLYLNENRISGKISSNISSLSNLVLFDLSNNQLVGSIPPTLGSLSKLQYVLLRNNSLTETIPPSLGNLSNLVAMDLGMNHLVGSIPDSLGQLPNLLQLSLYLNRLSGNITHSIFNISSLQAIDLGSNDLSGNLAPDLFISVPTITWLSLPSNRFTGSIPTSLSNLSNLEDLQLQENQFTGGVPFLHKLVKLQNFQVFTNNLGNLGNGEANDLDFLTYMTNATMLDQFSITGNSFGGVLPEELGNFSTSLRKFIIWRNQIQGSIPSGITNLINLEVFYAANNKLSGIIPYNIGRMQNLRVLVLSDNRLSGNIPPSLENITWLYDLEMGGNRLNGSIPSSLGKLQNLKALNLSRNNLIGPIPPQVLTGLSSLTILLDLSSNQLSGVLPMEVKNLISLGILDLSRNNLSGVIPATLSNCISLESLSLDDNFFDGSIPPSLSSLKALKSLNLSHNKLSGKIPEFIAHLKVLGYLNLSFNDLEGSLPTDGIFKNATATSVAGNSKLCGGIPEFQLLKCISSKKGLGIKLKLLIGIISVILGLILVVAILFSVRLLQRKKSPVFHNQANAILELSYHNLYAATEGFSSDNVIGKGSFGSVYKGTLVDGEGTNLIAIKVLNLVHRGALKTFITECETLKNIRHRNLLKLITVCSSIDRQGNDFKALIYEFMVNGSLEEWLHRASESAEARRTLNLLERLNIAIDVACALDYLHHQNEAPIVHCDLKPSNILLDEEMTAHVGDFGLARFLVDQAPNDSNGNQSSSIGVRGTVGYAPPEYGMGNEVGICGDVYSYGILLLEMITGRKPVEEMFNGGLNLHIFVQSFLPARVLEILDPVLVEEIELRDGRSSNFDQNQELVVPVFKIGVACSLENPGERMKMNEVAAQLISIRNKFLRSGRMMRNAI